MDTLDQLQAKLDKILNPSMPEPVAIPEVKAQPINPMYYQIAAGMGNNDGAATMSPVEKDLRTLTDNELYAKYGQQQADEMLGQLALASGELQRNNLAERGWGETAWDSTTGVANAFVGGLGSITAWGAGKVNADAGVALSDAVGGLRKFTEENQSDTLNARRKIGAVRDSLTQRDSDAQYDLDIKNGDSKTVAGLSQFGRDFVNSSVFDDSILLGQGTADAVGSFLTAGPVAGVLRKGLTTLIPKSATKVNSVADKLVWPAAIGTLESGGTYQQTVEDATNTLKQQGKTVGDKLELINNTAQQAADRMFLPAAALGTITRFGEKPFSVPSLKQAGTNILGRELPEEAGQGALGTILSNQAIQDKIDPNRKIGQGVADATVQGAVYGSLAAGAVQGPGIAKQSMISAAKATLGYVDKRTALAADKADAASPVGTKALKEKASTLVPNAEPVKQNLATELAGTDLTPEEKDQGIKYANDLIDSLRVNIDNEFSDITPELSSIISGSEHRIDAIQQLAKRVITTSDPNDKLYTAATLYQLLQPILDLQTNRPSSVDNLSPESQAVLKDYESLIANVNNSPTIKNAMKQIHEIMVAQGATVISPVMEEELDTPAGKQKVQSIITAANIAPDQGNLDATESIMKHAKEGKLNLTPEQTTTLNASVALLRARKELEEKNKQFGLNAADIVSSEILTDRGVKDNNARSATQYTQEILSAVRRGNTLGAAQLLSDMGLFVQHMKNKVEAINKHYLSGDTSKNSYVPYEALLPATRQWVRSDTNPKALYKGGFVNVASPDSIKFAQGVELEHKVLADVYNSLTEVFPDLGIDRIEPFQLDKGISGAVRIPTQEPTKPVAKEEPKPKVNEPEVKAVEPINFEKGSIVEYDLNEYIFLSQDKFGNATLSNMDGSRYYKTPKVSKLILLEKPKVKDKTIEKEQVKEPIVENKVQEKSVEVKPEPIKEESKVTPVETKTEPVVTTEVPVKQEQPVIDTTLDNELPTENTTVVDNSPIVTGNKNAVIKVKADVVAPSKFSNLVQGVKNFFINSFKFRGNETTRTDSVDSPLQFVKDRLLDDSLFQESVPNSKYSLNKSVVSAYKEYLGRHYNALNSTLAKNLQAFLTVPSKKGVIRLDRINKGDPLHRYGEGKVLNLTEKVGDTYKYNQHLLELATLAGLQWFLTAGQTERRLEARDIAKLTGISETKLSSSMINAFLNTSDTGQLSQGLTNTIKSFWGVSGISTEMMAYTDGIAEAMAAEIIRAFEELGMITKTSIYIDKTTNEQLIPDPAYYLTLQNQENDEETKKKIKTINRFEVNRFDNDALYSFPTAIQEVVLVESEDVTYFGDDIPPVPETQLGNPTIKLSRKEKKAIAAANKTEVKTNVLQANIIMSLTQDALKVMFGGGIENENMNKNTLAAIQGKNKTVLNAYQAMVDMLSKVDNVSKTLGKDASEVVMRFPHTITAVGRLMMLGKYNIQSSKLLREVFLPTWSTLDLQNNQDHIDAFHLAVSQALGIKVHNEGPESFNKLRVLLSGKLSPAITLVQEWMEVTDNGENPIKFDGTKLAQIFKDAKEGLTPNAFHALIEYVRYQRTEDKTKFTTGLYLEADGVTNGPGNAIQMLTLGRFTGKWVTTVEKIGHSFGEPKAKHELDKNNKDLYGTAGINTIEPLQNILSNMSQSPDSEEIMGILRSLYSLLSMNVKGISYKYDEETENMDLEVDRNAFKNPLTILLYGSGIPGIAGKATKQMADNIYKLFSDANVLLNSSKGKSLTVAQAMFPDSINAQETYDKFVSDLNRVMGTTINTQYINRKKQYVLSDVIQPVRKYDKSELQKFTFSGSEIDAITQNITKGLVDAMYEGAVQTVGKSVMDSTKLIQKATQIQSILLEAAFTKAVQDKIASHVATAKDTGYLKGDFISKQDFMDIMEELKVIAPYLKTPDQTFLAAKSGKYREENDKLTGYSLSLNSKYRTDPNMYIPTNAGVSGTPNLVIGMGDAYAILQAAIDESLVGNLWIYDGINMPLDKITDYAPKLNKAAFAAWQNNPLRVIEESFRSFMGAESMMKKALDEALSNEDSASQLNKSLKLYKEEDKLVRGSTDYALSIFNDLLNDLNNSADSIDARHAAIARMPNSVDQLAAAGVPYHNGVAVDPTLDTPEKIATQLNKYYQEELDKINNKPKAEPVKQMTTAEMDPITKDMLSNAYHHSSGVKILNAEGLANLGRSINLSREQKIGFLQIIRAKTLDGYAVIFGSVDQIREYRKQSNYSDISLDQETDNGFIDLKTKTIYLINPSVETLVHEMIHAATYGSVLNYYQDSSLNTKEVNDAIERTEGLMGEFLDTSPKELARLTPEARTAINNLKAAIQEPGNNLDNTSDVALAKSLNEFMAWSLSNQELISTFRKVEMPAYLRIAKEVIDIIKKFFTFRDKVTGQIKEQDLKVPKDLFGNLLFNASIIINNAQPSLAETMVETTLFHSANGGVDHITQLRGTLMDKVVLFLNNTGQPINVSLYTSGFGKTLTEASDTVSSLAPIFGISGVEETTLNYVVAALSTDIQVDPLTIDGIQTLYNHAVVELAKQVDAGTYPKAKYDALIGRTGNHKNIGGKSTLLPVFLGLSLIDTELRDALSKISVPTKAKNTTGTLNGGLENQANKMLDSLFKVLTGQRKAHDVADAILLLSDRLTEIALKEERAINSVFGKPGNNIDKANEWIRDNIAVVADKGIALGKKLETSQHLAVKRLGSAITVLSMMATDKNGETVARGAIAMANKGNTWKPFRSLVTDFIGRSDSNAETYDLIKKVRAAVQQMRQTFRDKVPKIIAQKFTRSLDKKEWATLFRSMAKTDLSSLMDILSKKEIMEIFSNPSSLNKHISMLETRIQNQDTTNWSLYQAKMKQLANFMNTGITGSNLLRNPYAIHSLLNETKPKGFQTMGRDTIHDIDQLTTLYAIQSLSQEDKSFMSDMVNEQSEGLEFIIDYLVGQNVTEITKLSTNPTVQLNYYKGHIPQINQSGASLIVAEDVNRADLLLQGYTRVGDYFGSNLDTNRLDKGYYFTDVSAKGAVTQGTIQNIQRTILGVDDFYGFTIGSNDRITDPIVVANITKRISRENVGIENLMPVFDKNGVVIAYERSMTPEKMAMLKPSEHLAEMIGVWRGRQLEEQLAQEINEEVIDKHYDMYLKDIANSPSSQKEYVDVLDPKQLDVVEQDMVSLFSIDTIRYMANKNNGKFYVRKDVLDDMIGYRKASVSDIFTGKTRVNKPLQDAIRKVLISVFGANAYRKAVKTERFLQNVVGEARTLIVVKSLVVPMFNIVSNIVQLVARGVPIATIVKSSPTKLLELRSYTMSQVKQVELEAEHRAASGDLRRQQVLDSQIQAIKDGHKRLSIWPLIEAGEFSTISDIGNNSEDIDLFSGNTESWLDKQVSKLPANAQTIAKYGMVARDTALFQGLQKMVQYGDFIAKAVMYDDLMKRKGLTKEQALGKITDEFVNYDKLPGRARGYLEDTGLLWFYNYKLRITKVALSMMRNNPLHLLLAHAAPIPLGAGIATEDNFITKLLDGSLTRSIGPGMVVGAPLLNPWYNATN